MAAFKFPHLPLKTPNKLRNTEIHKTITRKIII